MSRKAKLIGVSVHVSYILDVVPRSLNNLKRGGVVARDILFWISMPTGC